MEANTPCNTVVDVYLSIQIINCQQDAQKNKNISLKYYAN